MEEPPTGVQPILDMDVKEQLEGDVGIISMMKKKISLKVISPKVGSKEEKVLAEPKVSVGIIFLKPMKRNFLLKAISPKVGLRGQIFRVIKDNVGTIQ